MPNSAARELRAWLMLVLMAELMFWRASARTLLLGLVDGASRRF